jgi:hypothetical protein
VLCREFFPVVSRTGRQRSIELYAIAELPDYGRADQLSGTETIEAPHEHDRERRWHPNDGLQ